MPIVFEDESGRLFEQTDPNAKPLPGWIPVRWFRGPDGREYEQVDPAAPIPENFEPIPTRLNQEKVAGQGMAIPGELGSGQAQVELSNRAIRNAQLEAARRARAVTIQPPAGAIGTTGIVIEDSPTLRNKEKLKNAISAAETIEDLQRVIEMEGATARLVQESDALAQVTGRRPRHEKLPPPLSEDPVSPGLLQTAVDYLTRPISAIAGAEKAALEGGNVSQAVKDALSGRTKTFSEDALEAAGLPPGPPLVSVEGSLGFGAQAPPPIRATLAEVTPRELAGAALDFAQDPLSYASVGTSRGLRLADGTILNPAGQRAFAREIEKRVARGMSAKEARAAAEKVVARVAPRYGWIDKGGIKFAGATIPGTGAAQQTASEALKRAALAVNSTEAGAMLTQRLRRIASLYDRDAMVRPFEQYVKDKQRYLDIATADREDIVDFATATFHGLSDDEDKVIRWAIENQSVPEPFGQTGKHWLPSRPRGTPKPPPISPQGLRYPTYEFDTEVKWLRGEPLPATPDWKAGDELNLLAGQPLPPRLQNAALRIQLADQMRRAEEIRRGVGDAAWEDYMMHAFRNYPAVVAGIRQQLPGISMHDLQRKFATLEQAKAAGLEPVTEKASELFMLREIASSRAIRAQELIEDVARTYGLTAAGLPLRPNPAMPKWVERIYARTSKDLVEAPGFKTASGEPIYIPRAIAEDIGSLAPSQRNELLKAYDGIQNLWKGAVTAIFPSFHVRNATTNIVNSFLKIGIEALNPERHAQALRIMKGASGTFTTKLGQKYSYDELRRVFREHGLEGAYGDKLALRVTRGERTLSEMIPPLEAGRHVGSFIEDEARMALLLSELRRGASIEDAVSTVREVLFDYRNSPWIEREVLSRALPFVKFTARNVPYQAKMLLKEPGRYSAILKIFAQPGDQAEIEKGLRNLPEWVAEGLAIRTGATDSSGNELILFGTGLPMEDLNRIWPQSRASDSKAYKLFRKNFVQMLAPLAKYVAEQISQRGAFEDRPLKDLDQIYAGYGPLVEKLPQAVKDWLGFEKYHDRRLGVRYRMDPWALQLLRAYVMSRLYSTAGKMLDPTTDPDTQALNLLTGLRISAISPERSIYPAQKERSAERQGAASEEKRRQIRALLAGSQIAEPDEIEALLDKGYTLEQMEAEGILPRGFLGKALGPIPETAPTPSPAPSPSPTPLAGRGLHHHYRRIYLK
jgi:hypothetical protein